MCYDKGFVEFQRFFGHCDPRLRLYIIDVVARIYTWRHSLPNRLKSLLLLYSPMTSADPSISFTPPSLKEDMTIGFTKSCGAVDNDPKIALMLSHARTHSKPSNFELCKVKPESRISNACLLPGPKFPIPRALPKITSHVTS